MNLVIYVNITNKLKLKFPVMFIKVGNRHIFGQKFLSHQIFFGGKKCPKTVKKWEKFPNIEAWFISIILFI